MLRVIHHYQSRCWISDSVSCCFVQDMHDQICGISRFSDVISRLWKMDSKVLRCTIFGIKSRSYLLKIMSYSGSSSPDIDSTVNPLYSLIRSSA